MAVIDIKNCTLELHDGANHVLVVKVGDGTVTYDEKRSVEYLLDRGLIDEVRLGDQIPMDVSFTIKWVHIMSISGDPVANIPTPDEVLKQIGAASGYTSSDSDSCRPYAVDVVINFTPLCSTEVKENIVLPDFRWESLSHDLKAATISCSGKCNAQYATVRRGNQYS
jgi:hypothetical protein